MKKILSVLIILLVLLSFFFLEEGPFLSLLGKVPFLSQANLGMIIGGDVREERDELLAEKRILLESLVEKEGLERENEELRAALGVGLDEEEVILSKVTLKRLSEGLLVIDKGRKEGVVTGLSVSDSHKGLVGKVVQVYNSNSIVLLASSMDQSFAVKNDGRVARLVGRGGEFYLDMAQAEGEFSKDDIIVTSGTDGVFFSGLIVGQVTSIESSDTNPFQEGMVNSIVDPVSIEYVFVLEGS